MTTDFDSIMENAELYPLKMMRAFFVHMQCILEHWFDHLCYRTLLNLSIWDIVPLFVTVKSHHENAMPK